MTSPDPRMIYHTGPVTLDWGRALVLGPDGKMINLTVAEVRIVGILVAAWPEPVSRDEMYPFVMGRPYTNNTGSRTIDTTICEMRKKLPRDEFGRTMIVSVRCGVGGLVSGGYTWATAVEAVPRTPSRVVSP